MITKILGVILLIAGVCAGLSLLVALIGTALGLLWFAIKIAVPVALVYLGYRLLVSGREEYA